jgi:hypothetical protein
MPVSAGSTGGVSVWPLAIGLSGAGEGIFWASNGAAAKAVLAKAKAIYFMSLSNVLM